MLSLLLLSTLAAAAAAVPAPTIGNCKPEPGTGTKRVHIHPKGRRDLCVAIEDAEWPWKFGQWALIRKCKLDRGYVWVIKDPAATQIQVENLDWCMNAGTIPKVNWFPRNGEEAQTAYCSPWDEEPGNAIRWYYDATTSTFAYTATKQFCLDNAENKLVEGNKVQIWQCAAGSPNQQWDIEYL